MNVIVGITGGIAAYKAPLLVRLLRKEGHEVKCVATRHALQFVTPLTLETVSANKLYADLFAYDPIDLSYFFSPADTAVCANPVLYPDRADIERSTQEHDWGENTAKLIEMWSHVKGDNASAFTYIFIGLVLAAIAIAAICMNASKKRRKKSRRRK